VKEGEGGPRGGGGVLSINMPLLCRDVTSHKE